MKARSQWASNLKGRHTVSNLTPKQAHFQPILSNSDDSLTVDKRPLPELVAAGNPDPETGWPSFSLAHHDVEGKRYYAVQDWIRGVAQSENVRKFWNAMKRRFKTAGIEMSPWCRLLNYRAADGKTYKRDFTDAEGLYRITQRMDVNTGLRDRILQFLAQAGVKIDEYRIDPDQALEELPVDMDKVVALIVRNYQRMGKSDGWIGVRIQSSIQRVKFTSAFRRALREDPQQFHFALITDTMRVGIWKRTTKQLRAELNLKSTANLRDHLSELALTYEMLAEQIAERDLRQRSQLEFEQAQEVVRQDSEFVGKQADEAGRYLGIDIATDRPMLPAPGDKQKRR